MSNRSDRKIVTITTMQCECPSVAMGRSDYGVRHRTYCTNNSARSNYHRCCESTQHLNTCANYVKTEPFNLTELQAEEKGDETHILQVTLKPFSSAKSIKHVTFYSIPEIFWDKDLIHIDGRVDFPGEYLIGEWFEKQWAYRNGPDFTIDAKVILPIRRN